jgi:3-isopropylmalate/(R)-2-methylmalate dehydratase small subunit
MRVRGKAWKFGDFISTDLIAPGRYAYLRDNLPEFVKHVLEDADKDFAPAALTGDQTYIVVGGRNFGQGSSREHAARLIRLAGVPVVLAKGFARIFYRNCFNIGMPALTVDTDQIAHGDEIEIDLENGLVRNLTKKKELATGRIPPVMLTILREGGVVDYIKKHGDLVFDEARTG